MSFWSHFYPLCLEVLMKCITLVDIKLLVTHVANIFSGCLARKIYAMKRKKVAVILIQKYTRRWLLRNSFLHVYSAALLIQSGIRAYSARQSFISIMKHRAAIRIQVYLNAKIQKY